MKPWRLLDSEAVPDGTDHLELWQRDAELSIRLRRGGELMNSRAFGSERTLADLVCPQVANRRRPHVLVGGLGLGHTLAATLLALPADATVVVAELSPAVVRWNRGPLAHLAAHPLDDSRVTVHTGDVSVLLRRTAASWDAVLLDVDNGPAGLTHDDNDWLYSTHGLKTIHASLRKNGVLGVWSAHASPPFFRRLRTAGFNATEHNVRARAAAASPASPAKPARATPSARKRRQGGKGGQHVVWVAQRRN